MSEIMNVWTELSTAIRRLKSSDSPDVWTSYANLVQARAEDFNTLFLALEAENARYKEALEIIRVDVNEIDRMRTRAEKADAEVERLKERIAELEAALEEAFGVLDEVKDDYPMTYKILGRTLGGGRESSGFFTCQFCGAKLPPGYRKADCCDEMRKVVGGREEVVK